jgi:hypothetical protein
MHPDSGHLPWLLPAVMQRPSLRHAGDQREALRPTSAQPYPRLKSTLLANRLTPLSAR